MADARGTTRVAAIIDGGGVSGPMRQLASIIRPLREHGVELRPVLFQRAGRESPHIQFFRDAGADPVVLTDRGPFDPSPLIQLRRFLREWAPHVVQTHSYRPTALAWLLGLTGRRWAWVGWHHGVTAEDRKVQLYHEVDRILLPRADRMVVVAGAHGARFGGPRDHLLTIENAALLRAGVPGVADVPPVPGATEHLLAVGRLSHEKGIDVLLQAVAIRVRDGATPALIIAGEGPDRRMLEQMVKDLSLSGVVRFAGHVENVAALYAMTDVVVLPSRSEGMPNAMLEAIAADKPVVATRVGAVPEILSVPHSGVLVEPDDPEGLARGIATAMAVRDAAEGRRARAEVARRYGLAERVARHVALYDELRPSGSPG